ncbi:MAG: rubredoxin [Dehalococcoidia bacterium]|nr:High molecular weight rubredoxin [Chloroflexota bacterium]MBT9161535.1 High molecular weight rubredoxin [Chloroflexota bacterium]
MDTKALHKISYGLYIIGAAKGQKFNAQIANTVIQVCSAPPTISVCLNKGNLTHEFIQDSRAFTVSILAQDTPLDFIGKFGFKSGRETDKLRGINFRIGQTGAPIVLDNALAYMEANVISEADAGTHTIFLAELVAAETLMEGEPITYAYYQQVKRGSTPKAAPSYIEKKREVNKMAKYECTVCGYVYDPEIGDPESDIPPGTPFENLPDDWVCPVCGAGKGEFERM